MHRQAVLSKNEEQDLSVQKGQQFHPATSSRTDQLIQKPLNALNMTLDNLNTRCDWLKDSTNASCYNVIVWETSTLYYAKQICKTYSILSNDNISITKP